MSYWTSFYALGVDSKFQISPPGMVFIDRRIIGETETGFNLPVGDYAVRTNIAASYLYQRIQEKTAPVNPIIRRASEIGCGFDIAFPLQQDVEITLGFFNRFLLLDKKRSYARELSSSLEADRADILAPRLSAIKHTGNYNGGFYYVRGTHKTQSFRSVEMQQTITSDKNIAIPTQYGLVAAFPLSVSSVALDLSAVRASEGSPATQAGVSVLDDYLDFLAVTRTPLGRSMLLGADFSYRTASYSSSAFTNLDTMPLGGIDLYLDFGSNVDYWRIGVLMRRGQDRASITEFNSKYQFVGVGFVLGLASEM